MENYHYNKFRYFIGVVHELKHASSFKPGQRVFGYLPILSEKKYDFFKRRIEIEEKNLIPLENGSLPNADLVSLLSASLQVYNGLLMRSNPRK